MLKFKNSEEKATEFRFHVDGEGGEYETLVVAGPHMTGRLELDYSSLGWSKRALGVRLNHKFLSLHSLGMFISYIHNDGNMAFCPLDYRYGCQEFKEIWSELGKTPKTIGG